MTDVFISYKQNERTAIEQIATRLRALGLNVWFDASMSAGESFNDEIDREARAAKAILVCWSPAARESRWVKAEAMIGFEQDKLVACYVAGPDGFSPPTPFNTSHAEDLRVWLTTASDNHAGWKSVLRRIGRLCGRADIESWGALPTLPSVRELRTWLSAYGSSPLSVAVGSVLQEREAEEAERARLELDARGRRAKDEAERRAHLRATTPREVEYQVGWIENRRRAARLWMTVTLGALSVVLLLFIGLSWQQQMIPDLSLENPEYQEQRHDPAPILSTGQSATDISPESAFRDCAECPEMVLIPGQSFAVGRYEVTFAEWDACVAAGGCNDYRPDDRGWGRINRPVINVSWNDAQIYLQWLSRRAGESYRLLTSAEWEYAARAGTTTGYSWGNEEPVCDQRARNGANSQGGELRACSYRGTLPVGSFQPNAFGLYDMHGNVWEWVADAEGPFRVQKGGSWLNRGGDLQSANRNWVSPDGRNDNYGFRVARAV